MSSIELIINHSSLRDNEVVPFGENLLQKLDKNTLFVVAPERIALIRSNLTNYQIKLANCKDGNKLDTLQKNEAKNTLTTLYDDLALDLNVQAKGDREKLLTTGFTLVKETVKNKMPPKPVGFKVENGINDGDLIFSVPTNKDARMYVFFFTPAPAAIADTTRWSSVSSTSHKQQISGFTHGVEYECRCAYQGPDRILVFSDTIKYLAR
jgi:hypothetical protein